MIWFVRQASLINIGSCIMVCGHIKQTGIPKKKGAYMHRCGPFPLLLHQGLHNRIEDRRVASNPICGRKYDVTPIISIHSNRTTRTPCTYVVYSKYHSTTGVVCFFIYILKVYRIEDMYVCTQLCRLQNTMYISYMKYKCR